MQTYSLIANGNSAVATPFTKEACIQPGKVVHVCTRFDDWFCGLFNAQSQPHRVCQLLRLGEQHLLRDALRPSSQ